MGNSSFWSLLLEYSYLINGENFYLTDIKDGIGGDKVEYIISFSSIYW